MARKKCLTNKERIINAITKLPNPLVDKKHRIYVFFIDNRARSNESRFEHIASNRHSLKPCDIKRVYKKINESTLRKDDERKGTYSLYIKRSEKQNEYIKLSLELDFKESNKAIVKTMFITKYIK